MGVLLKGMRRVDVQSKHNTQHYLTDEGVNVEYTIAAWSDTSLSVLFIDRSSIISPVPRSATARADWL